MELNMSTADLWRRYQRYLCSVPEIDLTLDISRISFPDDFFSRMQPAIDAAYEAMQSLEAGAIANPDENRMVGHYWLRAPQLAPTAEIRGEIQNTLATIAEPDAVEIVSHVLEHLEANGKARVETAGPPGTATYVAR